MAQTAYYVTVRGTADAVHHTRRFDKLDDAKRYRRTLLSDGWRNVVLETALLIAH